MSTSMGCFDANTKVLIVGAGVSGLALAQILRKHDVDFEIFERDDGSRRQGWSLGLDKLVMVSKSRMLMWLIVRQIPG